MTELLMALTLGLSPSVSTKPTSALTAAGPLEGYYRLVAFECKGQKATRKQLKKWSHHVFWVKGNKILLGPSCGWLNYGSFTLDSSAKHILDVQFFYRKEKALGIYKVEGNRLTVCLDTPSAGRPTTFTTSADTKERVVVVLVKVPNPFTSFQGVVQLHGPYRLVAIEVKGRPLPTTLIEKWSRLLGTITINHHQVLMQSNKYCRIEVDPTQKPSTIDLFFDDSREMALGIYKVEGKRLTICLDYPRAGRPTRFATDGESKERTMIVLERIQD